MSRGSISSWQDYGRRNSHSVLQFSGSPVEFMTSDDMECKRADGWFLSYAKIVAIIVVFIIGVIAAGFLGWYINSLPKKKTYDSMALLSDDLDDTDFFGASSISPFIHPLKYHLELTPEIDANGTSTLEGRVVIEFRLNDTSSLSKFSLNARNITVTSYKLTFLDRAEGETRLRRGRKRAEDEINEESREDETIGIAGVFEMTNNSSLMEGNRAILYEGAIEYAKKNPPPNEISNGTMSHASLSIDESEEEDSGSLENSTINSNEIEITKYKVDDEKGIHVVYLLTPIEGGIYSLEINYNISVDNDAFFTTNFNDTNEEKWLMETKLKPFGARRLLPVFDDVRLKSVFSVSVSRPREMRVLSNMPLRSSRDTPDNTRQIDVFEETPLISPYNVAFLMGYIESVDESLIQDSRITFWGEPRRHSQGIYLLDKLEPVVINLIDVFAMPYPLPKLDLVCLPPGIDENLASPGLISIKQSLFYTTNQSPLVMKHNSLMALVNLFSQQWLGGVVNVNWTDTWILEGSLIHLHHDIPPKIDSSLYSSNSFVVDVQLKSMQIDGYSISRPHKMNINRHLDLFDYRYAKGACLIRMLHGAIGDSAFWNGYKKFISRWKYDTADITEFLKIMGEEANDLPPKISLEEFMDSWTSQSGYPIVTVTRNYETRAVLIRQDRFMYDKPLGSTNLWHIPLSYVNDSDSWSSPAITWLQSEPELILNDVGPKRSWILFNVNKTGYYRVHYDERNWLYLKKALWKNHTQFPPETRASLVDDIFSLAAIGWIKYEAAFDFIKYMQMNERHYAPWGALMRHVFKLNRLLYETPAFTDFQEFMLTFISPLYADVGTRHKEGSRLTLIAVRMACVFEHPECLEWARDTFEIAKTDSEIRQIIPSYVREAFYCTIARSGTRKEWNYFIETVNSIEDKEEKRRLLSSFACFQAPWILQSILNELLHDETFQEEEISIILKEFPRNPAAAQAASRFVRVNWHEIVQRFAGSYSTLRSFVLSMINGLTSEQDLEDLEMFREHNYENMKGTRYAAAIVEVNSNFVMSWLKRSLPEIEKLMKKHVDRIST